MNCFAHKFYIWGFRVVYALLKSLYLAVSLCLCHSIRSSVLCSVLMCINATSDQYAPSHGHLCVAFRWGTDGEGTALTAALAEVSLRRASLQGRKARPATKQRCISVGALKNSL